MTTELRILTVRQPMPRPATWAEFEQVRPLMIDTQGNQLESAFCEACGVKHFTVEPCLSDIRCPQCGSTSARCRRPSSHEADGWHAERVAELDRVSLEREATGLPAVARWPEGEPTLFEYEGSAA